MFWNASSLQAVQARDHHHGVSNPFATSRRMRCTRSPITPATDRPPGGSGQRAGFLTRTIKKVLDEETVHLENGLTVLATIGATAPFVGLFGTVWGVYHALVAIGLSGSGSLERWPARSARR